MSAPIGGSAADHARLNLDHLVEAGFPLDRFNGGCTDHKAECEIRETFELLMASRTGPFTSGLEMFFIKYHSCVSMPAPVCARIKR